MAGLSAKHRSDEKRGTAWARFHRGALLSLLSLALGVVLGGCSSRSDDGAAGEEEALRCRHRSCCTPTTCASQGASCGSVSNGCGGTLDCGACASPETCGGGGTPNVCGAAQSGTHSVSLAWVASSTAGVTYEILRGTATGGPYTQIRSGVTGTSSSDTTVTSGMTYYYVVRAQNGAGESASSNEVAAAIP